MIAKITDNLIHYWKFILAFFATTLGYFDPIKDIVHLILAFFIIDVIYGWRADKKLNGAKFKTSIVWETTIPRMIATVIIMICTFLLDEVTGQEFIRIYSVAGYFIAGLILISIMKNMYIVTKWEAIPLIGKFVKNKIENQTGEKIEYETN